MKTTLLFSLFSAAAFANGGPVAWSGGSARGGIEPRQSSRIELVEEALELKLLPDREHYEVRAEYTLRNPDVARAVDYGVPIAWTDEDGEAIGMPRKKFRAQEGRKAAQSVRIRQKDKVSTCRYEPAVASSDQIGWCVTALTVPAGESKLVLEYTGELQFTDTEYSSSALTQFSPRVLQYPLFPAGFWKGTPRVVKVRVDPGPYGVSQKPDFAKLDGKLWTWEWKGPDLKNLKSIQLELNPRGQEARQLAEWNRRKHGRVAYQGDSGLADLFDGKTETAWCAKGKGASFELRARPDYSPESYCHFEGLAFSPGHLKNDETYRAHARVKHVRVSGCGGDPRVKMDFHFHDLEPRDEATQFLAIPYGDPLAEAWRCLRVDVIETEPANGRDTCISEVAGIMGCG